MTDLFFVIASAGFFGLAATYIRFCEKLRGGGHE
jgi:hypothetical protein